MQSVENKKQHYVPVFFIKGFSSDKRTVSSLYIDENRVVEEDIIKKICQEEYFYGENLALEKAFQKKEWEWSRIIKKVVFNNVLDDNDKAVLKDFAVFQRERTKATAEYRFQQNLNTTSEYMDSILNIKDIDIKQVSDISAEIVKRKAIELSSEEMIMKNAFELAHVIDDLSVIVVNNNTEIPFICSDTPVVSINPFGRPGFGLAGAIIFYPISSHKLIFIYDSNMYNIDSNECVLELEDYKDVLLLNTYQYISAKELIFGEKKEDLTYYNKNAEEYRKKTKEQEAVTILGDEEHKFLAIQEKEIKYNGEELSFCKLPRAFRRIPVACREAFPRQYDKQFEKKLNSKNEIFSKFVRSIDVPDIVKKMNDKHNRRGFRDFAKQASLYWAKKR